MPSGSSAKVPAPPAPPQAAPIPQAPTTAPLPNLPTAPAGYTYTSLPALTSPADFMNSITGDELQNYFNANSRKIGNQNFIYSGAGSQYARKGLGSTLLGNPSVQASIISTLAQQKSDARNQEINLMVPQLVADPNYRPSTISAETSASNAVNKNNSVKRIYSTASQSNLLQSTSSGSSVIKQLLGE